jgi:hypothetical protein
MKSTKYYITSLILILIYSLLHTFSWDFPLEVRDVGMTGYAYISLLKGLVTLISVFLVYKEKKTGFLIAFFPAIWQILGCFLKNYPAPDNVWWYPLFNIMIGLIMLYFIALNLKKKEGQSLIWLKLPENHGQIVMALLILQVCQKIVRELVVTARDFSTSTERMVAGVTPVIGIAVLTLVGALLIWKQSKYGFWIAYFCGGLLIVQPLIYHIILGRPCVGGIWWYPFFTLIQGILIVYFTRFSYRESRR